MTCSFKYIFKAFAVLATVTTCGLCKAQSDTSYHKTVIGLSAYLKKVGQQNLTYIAAQYDVSIAEAAIESAKVFPDPALSAGVYDNQQSTMHLGRGYNAGLSTTIELGGKRKARIGLAASQADLSRALLQDNFRNLRADASLAYFAALQRYYQYMALDSSANTMQRLADADSIRFKLGAIMEIDARQSSLEARNMRNNLTMAVADWKTALVQLNLLTGQAHGDTLLTPSGNFEQLFRTFQLPALIDTAQAIRADVVAARQNKIVSEKNYVLVKANRKIDLGVSVGFQQSGESTNDVAPTPAYRSVNAGLSIPLKLSNRYKGDLKAARYAIRQSDVLYEQVLLQIQTEVTQSYINYNAAAKQVEQYHNGLLTESQKILDGKIYSYKRGETSLLDVLNAQRSFNDMRQNYYQALYQYAASLVELERTSGIWDIE